VEGSLRILFLILFVQLNLWKTKGFRSHTTLSRYSKLHSNKLPHEEVRTSHVDDKESRENNVSIRERITSSSVASAAAVATAAVNAAVSMKVLSAPDVSKSYISLDSSEKDLDRNGLPLVYDKDQIEIYWRKERGALNDRWGYFVSKAVPFLTRLVTLFIKDGKISEQYIPELSKQARIDLQDLGPTFIKAGQMMSVRPDVLPQSTLDELALLQDSVVPFSSKIAVLQIEEELGGPLGQFFTMISEEPIAAASLAQVYLATLNDGKNTKVAVKVQRPDVLATVSKDLYVLRRAAEVFQGLVQRFAPQQKTNYVGLLNEWAIGFYTELDFLNEARNQKRLREMLLEENIEGVMVPQVFEDYTTRRLLVSEFIEGKKLSDCSDEQIANVTPLAQEAFLTQLFQYGFFHADPHPGNILVLDNGTIALIDCGLMASISPIDRDFMIAAVIHLANKDYASLVDDFINLDILPADSDRAAIIPLMDKALSPYVKGGGAKKYEEELKKLYGMKQDDLQSQVGGFQSMTQDALTVLNDVPFSIPPYFAILGRAIVTLEGIALTGDPNYGIIMESYPFIARKLLREDRPEIQMALQQVLYDEKGTTSTQLKFTRLISLLNNAAGVTVGKDSSGVFVDLDATPESGSGISFKDGLKYLLSDGATSLLELLEKELDFLSDILLRQILRRGSNEAFISLSNISPRPPTFLRRFLPSSPIFQDISLPLLLPPSRDSTLPTVGILSLNEFIALIAPKIDRNSEIYLLNLSEITDEFLGEGFSELIRGEGIVSTQTARIILNGAQNGVFGYSSTESSKTVDNIARQISSTIFNIIGSERTSNDKNMQVFLDVVNELDTQERNRFNYIVDEILKRNLNRISDRLIDVPRLL